MQSFFYLTALVALVAALRTVSGVNAVHALLHLIVTLLAIAVLFFLLGASFAAALQVIIYAGAIMVLVIFVIMMLNRGAATEAQERAWLSGRVWVGPAILCAILLAEFCYLLLATGPARLVSGSVVDAVDLGVALYGPYLLVVELASILLMAGLVGANHLTRNLRRRGGRSV